MGEHLLIPSGMISAGMDWQRQTIEANSASVPHQRTIDNTGLYLTSQKQLSSVIVEGAIRPLITTMNLTGILHGKPVQSWEFVDNYRVIASMVRHLRLLHWATCADNPAWNTKGNPNLNQRKVSSGKWALEGLTQGIDWRLSLYQNDIDNLIAFRDNTYINQ